MKNWEYYRGMLSMDCRNCIYCNTDYIWCDETQDEFENVSCDKGRDELMTGDECPIYTKCPPYKEQSTVCDRCVRLYKCISENRLLETTMSGDNYRHYIFELDDCPRKGIR
jgi:hypothetical protein